jgi:hypothetical protein
VINKIALARWPQGGYLERHKRHRPNSPIDLFDLPADPTTREASWRPAAAGSSHVWLPEGLMSLGNFTDAIHTNLDLLTLSNVYPGSSKMWLHLASVYIITLVALKVRGGSQGARHVLNANSKCVD